MSHQRQRKQDGQQHHYPISLEDKVEINGGSNGYALEIMNTSKKAPRGGRRGASSSSSAKRRMKTPRDAYGRPKRNRSESSSKGTNINSNQKTSIRSFDRSSNLTNSNGKNINIATPAYIRQSSMQQETTSKTPYNPYKDKGHNAPPSSAKFTRHHSTCSMTRPASKHIVCALSENLARETCITTMDATSPNTIEIHKMANGQTYIETLSYLEMINPHEILLNEGRRNSQLCRKVLTLFQRGEANNSDDDYDGSNDNGNYGKKKGGRRKKKNTNSVQRGHQFQTPAPGTRSRKAALSTPGSIASVQGECQIQTMVKFLPRSYFDQTRGAELLQRVAHDSSYDPFSIINEYIVLSSSHSLLSYVQSCLGSNFNRNSVRISMNWGGKYRMAIDRNTISHLELLANAKTGRNKNSLIGTIDCTKTNVGSRLLRCNLMSPPTGIATINARLDLVDCFLDDEGFFYEVLEQLQALPDVDKMMAHISLVPNTQRATKVRRKGAGVGKNRQITARMASRGISALVCIKSILSVIPNFARVLEIQLRELDERDKKRQSNGIGQSVNSNVAQDSNKDDEDSCSDSSIAHSKKKHKRTKSDDTCTGDSSKLKSSRVDKCDSDGDDDDDDMYLSDKENDTLHSENSRTTRTRQNDEKEDDSENKTVFTNNSSLLIGLGGGEPTPDSDENGPHARHQLLRAIMMAMKQSALKDILDSVLDIFTESTTYSKNSHAMRHQECFALKPNTDGMMDVLRKAFLANVDDIYRLADEYAETHGFTVVVKETAARGYYLSIPVTQAGTDLPSIFIQPVKSGKYYNCTTEEVHSLNSRAQENVQDLLLMTHERIQECIEIARQKYDALASLSDAIALIDMCHCFADNVASSRQAWCRPIVTDCCHEGMNTTLNQKPEQQISNGIVGSGAIAIRNGRFAIDVSKAGLMVSDDGETNQEYIPNDTYASAFQNFTVITGINGSGKSTYLKQIAITVILAHCGSYVPADEAYIPVRDRLCTRIGTTDDQEHNISTFMQEMKDTAFICKNATDKSLILIDELGRATSNEDGVAIAWAIGEFLLVKRAMTFFVTHYPQLCRMADIYPNVQNQHLGAISKDTGDEVLYTHKIMPGPCRMSADYGVDMASTCGWEHDVVQMARKIRGDVESKLPDGILCQHSKAESNVDMIAVRNKAECILNNLAKHLVALKASEGRLNRAARRSYLQDLHDQFVETDDDNVVRMMKSLLLEDNETVSPKLPLHPEGLIGMRKEVPQSVQQEAESLGVARYHDNVEEENMFAPSSSSSSLERENNNTANEEIIVNTSPPSTSMIETFPLRNAGTNVMRELGIDESEEKMKIESSNKTDTSDFIRSSDTLVSGQRLGGDHSFSDGTNDNDSESSSSTDDDGSSVSSEDSASTANSSSCSSSSSGTEDSSTSSSSSSLSPDEMSTT